MLLGHGGLLASRSLGLARGATLPYPRQRRQLSGSGGGPLDRLGDLVRARVGIKEDDGMYGTGLGEGPGLSEGSPLLNWNLEEIKTSPGLGFGFSAGGLLFPYFVGNAVALKRLGLVNSETVFAGSSAGSLISACLVCDLEADELMDNLLRMYRQLREEGTIGNVRSVVETYAHMVFPEDVHVLASGRLNVSVVQCSTRKPFLRSVYVNEFESKDDLVQALLTSSHVPLYMNTRVTSTFRGQTCVDGGLGENFIPRPPCEEPVTICCFPDLPFECDIAPGKYSECPISMSRMLQYAALPPQEEKIIELFEMGCTDVLDWATHTTRGGGQGQPS
ncbi:patatin-like phospholipase domain-containing protein [Chloropicon roscoffensis]|uniref:Patatin n=1 Tax=Chloropicon roscoffensis TaxID=1461544 RepID=A0A7S3CAZ9_9CHLO|mmetsp:Transcript_1548/g.4849  ORF Transcript_1548/g.4849 Transcript_1548/m.4849 type:complete len:333 (+) Transcript_1548:129-1127(+)|eukprot:CAMPEP_0198464506 /NCGR_PEP_ID=MMETSP1456-20131121/2647_1 /TAXON_ID=1461544 ORGANISM="Unidentified sp., Strain RCC1871" /NCGR_SAMPLE_ID=MMETSP1456 /ASSEMBLY_ACC=CAM_ASM_001119 /LENGTH=332 /DNA_ID=CAMNT_0044190219 /DNA_START=167 /DNA_END=1165 /DNA_ORIENTATION=-